MPTLRILRCTKSEVEDDVASNNYDEEFERVVEEPARKKRRVVQTHPSIPPLKHPKDYKLDRLEEIEEEE